MKIECQVTEVGAHHADEEPRFLLDPAIPRASVVHGRTAPFRAWPIIRGKDIEDQPSG